MIFMLNSRIKIFKNIEKPFFMESIEGGADLEKIKYKKTGEAIYADGRQVLVRGCHDALIACDNQEGRRGILLIRRDAEPAKGYLWCLGGGLGKGEPMDNRLASIIKSESGLDVDEDSYVILGYSRAIWKTTPHKKAEAKRFPLGTDDVMLLFYVEGHGKINLDRLHSKPLIVTPAMYNEELRAQLHPYIQMGMDRAIKFLK